MKLWPMKSPAEYVLRRSRMINNAWQMFNVVLCLYCAGSIAMSEIKNRTNTFLISMIVIYTACWAYNNTVIEKKE